MRDGGEVEMQLRGDLVSVESGSINNKTYFK